MSLASCLRKFGQSISSSDRKLIRSARRDGVADLAAVEQVMGQARLELEQLAGRIADAGGQIRRVAETGEPLFSKSGKPFYSALARAVDELPDQTAAAAQWKGRIQNLKGVKAEELHWTGVLDWLDTIEGKVSKADVQTFLNDSGVVIQDRMLGMPPPSRTGISYGPTRNQQTDRRRQDLYVEIDAMGYDLIVDPDGETINVLRRGSLMPGERIIPESEFLWDDQLQAFTNDAGERLDESVASRVIEYSALVHAQPEWTVEGGAMLEPMFDRWTLPGGENYRELLIVYPEAEHPKITKDDVRLEQYRNHNGGTDFHAYIRVNGQWRYLKAFGGPAEFPHTDVAVARVMSVWNTPSSPRTLEPHFNIGNVIAHTRFNERTDTEGNRVLFVEEVQSVWAQRGHKYGFAESFGYFGNIKGPNRLGPLGGRVGLADDFVVTVEDFVYHVLDPASGMTVDIGNRVVSSVQQAKLYASSYFIGRQNEADNTVMPAGGMPRGPFVGSTDAWTALVLKRLIRYAAENDFDRVAFTTGEQQVQRYSLEKHVDMISYSDAESGGIGRANLKAPESTGMLRAWKNGERLIERHIKHTEIEDYIGKELAEKLLNSTPRLGNEVGLGVRMRTLTGLDIKIGGQGMRAYYDDILPKSINKVLKQLGGGKVEQVTIGNREAVPVRMVQPGFVITPEMKEKALAGMPLFARNQQNTPEFKRWFRQSKAIGVFYHGAARAFTSDQFRRSMARPPSDSALGFHFGTKQAADDRLADVMVDVEGYPDSHPYSPNTIPVYLSIQNPLRLRDIGAWHDPEWVAIALRETKIASDEEIDIIVSGFGRKQAKLRKLQELIESKGYDGIVYANVHEGLRMLGEDEPAPNFFYETLTGDNYMKVVARLVGSHHAVGYGTTQDEARESALATIKRRPSVPVDSWVAFHPQQVKSAIGNIGTFDPTSPNLLFARDKPISGRTSPKAGWLREAYSKMRPERFAPFLRVRFAETTADLPLPNVPPDVEGAYFQEGSIWFVEENLTPENFQSKFEHEVFAHLAIERDPRFLPIIQSIQNAMNVGNREILALEREVRSRGYRDEPTVAREILALLAERGSDSPILTKFKEAVSSFANEYGLRDPTKLSSESLKATLRLAAGNLERDAKIAREFAAAARVFPEVNDLAESAGPTDEEIIDALRALDRGGTGLDQGLFSVVIPEIEFLKRRYQSIANKYKSVIGPMGIIERTIAEQVRPELAQMRTELDAVMTQILGRMPRTLEEMARDVALEKEPPRGLTAVVDEMKRILGLSPRVSPSRTLAEITKSLKGTNAERELERLEQEHWSLLHPFGFDDNPLFARHGPAIEPELDEIMARTMAAAPEDLGILGRVRKTVRDLFTWDRDAVVQGFIDDAHSVKQLEVEQFGGLLDASQSAYKQVLSTRNLPSTMTAVMLGGALTYKDGSFQIKQGSKSVVEIFRPLTEHAEGNLLHLWENYASAKRALGRRLGSRPHAPYSPEDINKLVDLEKRYPVFKDVLDDWTEFNNATLDLLVDRGVLDGDMVELWKENVYAPWYRLMEEAKGETHGPRGKRGFSSHGAQRLRRRLKAESMRPIGNVFENMMMNTAYAIDEAFKNEAMRRIVEIGEHVAMTRIELPWESVSIPNAMIVGALKRAGMLVGTKVGGELGGLTKDQMAAFTRLFRRVAPKGPNIVSYYEGGKPAYFEVNDDLLMRSIQALGQESFARLTRVIFGGPKRLLTSAVTLDPAFMAANLVRDTLSTFVVAGVTGMRPIIDAMKGAYTGLTDPYNADMLAIMAAGGGGGGHYDVQPENLRKFLVDRLGSESAATRFEASLVHPRNIYRFWRRVGSASENANRLAVFRGVKAAGGSTAEAAYQARDVLNFTMHGDFEAMRWLTMTVPFLNARVQGLYRLVRGARSDPRGFIARGSMIIAITAALLLRNDDRDEYEELPEWDKDMYWHVFLNRRGARVAEGDHWRVPKPFEVGLMFGTVPERAYRLARGNDQLRTTIKRSMAALSDTLAFNPIPQVGRPAVEQFANKVFFTDRPIVGMREQLLPPEAQYAPWTSETARAAAEAMPEGAPEWMRSPQRLEHLVRGYLGATGMYVLAVSDMMARSMGPFPDRPEAALSERPVIRRFLQPAEPRYTKFSDELYELLGEADRTFRAINEFREQQRVDDARQLFEKNRPLLAVRAQLRKIATQVTQLNNQQRRVLLSDLSPEEKREQIRELTERRNNVVARVAQFSDL